MYSQFQKHISLVLQEIEDAGLFKNERVISSPQSVRVNVAGGGDVLNLCANNYLGLAQHPEIREAAIEGLNQWGFGLSSVRFICGTQEIHKNLETKLSRFLGTEDTILYSSCFDANGGLFETLLSAEDAVISDELNHASIIDGVRLCKAKRYRYKNSNMEDLESQLQQAAGSRHIMIVTDGVFSMDGSIAKLDQIAALAEKYRAVLVVDDSHAVGVIGSNGRGTHEHCGVMDKVDIITGTLGKALGGASGGYVSGKKEVVSLLRQRSRPYLFSNSVAPVVVAASLKALELIQRDTWMLSSLKSNTKYFRDKISGIGLEVLPGEHPIIPIMLKDATLATRFADKLLDRGVYVVGFSYPVVPKGMARIRTQISAAHTFEQLDKAVSAFEAVKSELGC